MDQLERITRMEQALDSAAAAVAALSAAAEQYGAAQEQLRELAAYYGSRQWQQDYDDDCAGRLPRELKRGVLSQDGVYDLLTERDRLMDTLRRLAGG